MTFEDLVHLFNYRLLTENFLCGGECHLLKDKKREKLTT